MNKICQRGTRSFSSSKPTVPPASIPTTFAFSFLTLDEMFSLPSKTNPLLVHWVPSPTDFVRTICLKFYTFPLHCQLVPASWIISINIQTCCNVTWICFWMSSWELHILLVVSFDSCVCRFSKCYRRLSLTFDLKNLSEISKVSYSLAFNPFLLEIFRMISTFLSKSWLTHMSNFIDW